MNIDNMNTNDELNLKIHTETLLKYLISDIADDLIINSFLKNIKITKIENNIVYLELEEYKQVSFIESNYIPNIKKAISEVINPDYGLKIGIKDQFNETSKENKNKEVFSTNINKRLTLENYVESDFNENVVNAANSVIESLGEYSPLFIYSNSGMGKTHLLHAVGNKAKENGLSAIYFTIDNFTSNIYKASKSGKVAEKFMEFEEFIFKHDIIMFDDIQSLVDRNESLKLFKKILDYSFENKKQLIITSDKNPNELGQFQERFITRFNSGLTLEIKNPSIDDLIKIITYKLEINGLKPNRWEDESIKFIARNHLSSIRAIEGAISRVKFLTKGRVGNIKYTMSVVSNFFEQIEVTKDELTYERILLIVSSYYKISKVQLISKSRKKEIVIARDIAIYLIRELIELSYKKIGTIFSNRDHSTIHTAYKRISKEIKVNIASKQAVSLLENKIKKIS